MKNKIINVVLVVIIILMVVLIVRELTKKEAEPEKDFYTFLTTDVAESDKDISTIYAFDKDDKCVDTRIKYTYKDEETAKEQYEKLKKEESNYNVELHSESVIYSTSSNNEKTKTEIKNSTKNAELTDM